MAFEHEATPEDWITCRTEALTGQVPLIGFFYYPLNLRDLNMDPTVRIDERVDVIVVFQKNVDTSLLCGPYRMQRRGREIEFTELALQFKASV